jgi:hypothetical protein
VNIQGAAREGFHFQIWCSNGRKKCNKEERKRIPRWEEEEKDTHLKTNETMDPLHTDRLPYDLGRRPWQPLVPQRDGCAEFATMGHRQGQGHHTDSLAIQQLVIGAGGVWIDLLRRVLSNHMWMPCSSSSLRRGQWRVVDTYGGRMSMRRL